ncbi:hypothetical protein LTR91_001117 [Friedmanniomyces endolithicus]|uniref:NmrA-like domain-containing protein n=1 Tax=Friedmanniomyces endolithicus TaxID=329885 RepID=A0AAN6L0L0_9PEZI|nr:hypothetical protein LTR35_015267 [Friedmanniomyces endolithicus]KAK0318050.1 hypothetical protein LTR82_011040 [Friedmanniomyces endolithicus]KAK0922955.1 hypothetical protein LTR57_007252 [Friedmanniomyces endolithicus]KAK1011387.1 hypothetical protein LTS01_001243 [Friedmanniomyces endolithicus]KAK1014254.1 hypothetical protein LTR91_001117 [Friedmanniomyces endolithicus]
MASVLVFGATGVAGIYIVNALVAAKPSFPRLGIFTSQNTVDTKGELIQRLKGEGVHVHVGDVGSDEDVLAAYKDYDTIVHAAGRNAILSQIGLLRLAEQSPQIKRFLPSEYGTDIEYSPASANEKPHQLKLKVRAYIQEHVKRVQHTYVVTGPYAEMALTRMPPAVEAVGSFDVHAKKATLLGSGDEPVSYTTMPDLGRFVVATLLHPEPVRNRAIRVNSFTTTAHDVLAEFEKQTSAKWSVSHTSLEELKKLEKVAWESDKPFATVYTLRRIWVEGGTLYKERDNALVGCEDSETLTTLVERVIRTQTDERAGGQL